MTLCSVMHSFVTVVHVGVRFRPGVISEGGVHNRLMDGYCRRYKGSDEWLNTGSPLDRVQPCAVGRRLQSIVHTPTSDGRLVYTIENGLGDDWSLR
jgi:hypothetical protein